MAFKRILLRRDTSSNWTSGNAVLASGEVGYETNTGKFKIGNGSTAWTSLGYSIASNISAAVLNDLGDVTITSAADGDFLRWNGTAWINDAVNLSTDTIGSFVQSLVAGTGVTLSGNSGENATPTVAVDTSVIQARVTDVSDTEIGYLNGVTSAIQTQINTKAPLASPTFTGTVTIPTGASITAPTGLVKGDVGLGNVDNTSDANKPVSTAGQTALDLKANLASPTFTGTVVLPDNTVALGTKTTGDYVATITGGTGVASTAATTGEGTTHSLSIGQAVGTTDNVTFAGVTADLIKVGVTAAGEIDTTSGNLTIDSAGGTVTIDDNLTVTGNLTVSGTTTSINTETLTVDDNIIVLNNNVTAAPTENAGIEIERGSETNVVIRWNETDDAWELTNNGSTYSAIATASSVSSATALTVDNLSDVVITSAANKDFLMHNGTNWVDQPITVGTDTTGNYMTDVSAGTGISITHTAGEGSTATIGLNASIDALNDVTITSAASGQFLKWNGTAWINDAVPVINNIDDITGVTITAAADKDFLMYNGTAWVDQAITLGTDTTGNYMTDVSAGTGITVTHTAGEGSTATIALNAGIDALSDVTITSAATSQLLQYNGSAWVNATVSTTPTWEDENNIIAGRVFA